MFSLRLLLSFCLISCQFQPGVAYKSIAYKKKRLPFGYNSENSESVCTLYALQNRKFSEVFIGRESPRISVSVFWSRNSPSSFYQNF